MFDFVKKALVHNKACSVLPSLRPFFILYLNLGSNFPTWFHRSFWRLKNNSFDYVESSQEVLSLVGRTLGLSDIIFRIFIPVSRVAHLFTTINCDTAPSAPRFGLEFLIVAYLQIIQGKE